MNKGQLLKECDSKQTVTLWGKESFQTIGIEYSKCKTYPIVLAL